MKHEIIYTDDYALIVSDEQIKDVRPHKGKFHLEKGYIINQFPTYLTDLTECKLIIAHRPLTDAPILEGVPFLPEFSQDNDVEDLAKDVFPYLGPERVKSEQNRHTDILRCGFKAGYNKAKETYKFAEDDLRKVIEASRDIRYVTYSEEEIIQSIQQPKLPQYFECKEQKDCPYDFTSRCTMDRCDCKTKLKTTTNVQGYTELVGDYIYE
jgi:hypothetical protein